MGTIGAAAEGNFAYLCLKALQEESGVKVRAVKGITKTQFYLAGSKSNREICKVGVVGWGLLKKVVVLREVIYQRGELWGWR